MNRLMEDVPEPSPAAGRLAEDLENLLSIACAGIEAPIVAEAAIRVAAAMCRKCARPGQLAELFLLGSDMFRRWAEAETGRGRPN